MKRFTVFSTVLALVGASFCFVYWLEFTLMRWVLTPKIYAGMPLSFIGQGSVQVWKYTFKGGLIAGASIGLALAVWDLLRQPRDQSAITRLFPNLSWCACYALIIAVADLALVAILSGVTRLNNSGVLDSFLPLFGVIIPNATAILWGAIRSIATHDVLTPRVLSAKLRERARLQ